MRGVAVGDDEVRAGAVVVSTGGFGNNPELVKQYFPYTELAGDWLWYLGADGSRGDALSFAKQIDAQVVRNVEGQPPYPELPPGARGVLPEVWL